MATITKTHDDYTIAWVCALSLEAVAAKAMLDKSHPPLPQPPGDDNAYELGEMSGHNIVIAYLPAGVYGTVSAATVVAQMRSSFHSVRFALLVGIGGGVPSPKHDIRLGDVVVSQPTGNLGGVVQYDYGKTIHGGFQCTGIQSPPPPVLLNAMARLKSREIDGYNPQMEMVSDLLNTNDVTKSQFRRPSEQDQLFRATYNHPKGEETCISCDKRYLTHREPRVPHGIRIHYGIIASANQVMEDGITRDRIAQQYGILCFEMEAAGIMNQIPCLVVRGICDYSDSHKNKQWQGYAALVAAVYSKILLSVVPANQSRKDQASRTASWMVPFTRNPRFLGRDNLVQELEQAILQKGGARKRALTGLGGTGKTQIALELAYHVHITDPECSIFWIPAMSHESIEQAFVDINDHLGFQNVPPTEVKARVKNYLSSNRAGRWLLIIDNADDTEMWTSSSTASSTFKSYLPYSEDGFVLFTTRNRQLATRLVGPDIINVTEMDENMATDLLRGSLIEKNLMQDRQTTSLLLQQLSCLPLAIVQAASYLNETGMSLRAYVDLLQGQENDMIELLSEDFEDEWRYTETRNPVAVTWLISFVQIQKQNPLAADYLSFMACIHPRSIPKSLLPPGRSTVQQQKSLGVLNAYSFITIEENDQLIHLHRLVHLATRNWLRGEDRLTERASKTVQRLSEVFPSSAHEHRALWREYMPHAQFVLQSQEFRTHSRDHISFIQNVAECLEDDGKYHEAELLFRRILKEKSTQLPEDHEDILSTRAWVASTVRDQGRWTEAEQLEVQVMKTRKTVLGPEHPDTLTSMGNLAITFSKQGRWAEAEQLEVQVMKTRKTVLGPEHPDTLTSMGNLAITFSKQGRWAEAEQLEVQVMKTRKTVLGPEHHDTLTSMGNLAITFSKQGRWTEAEQLFVQVIETRKTMLGPEHPDTLMSIDNLASTFRKQGRWAEAEQLEVQVMKTRKTVLGPEHPDTLTSMNNLASTFRDQGWWTEAEQLFVQVTETMKTVLGPEHPDTLMSMANLASTFSNQGRWTEAEQLEMQIIKTRKTVLGPEHHDTLTSMNNLAFTFSKQGRWTEAEQLFVQVMETRKTVLGPEHPDTLTSMGNLAITFSKQGRWAEAEQLEVQVMKTRKTVLGPEHPDTLTSMNNLASTFRDQGWWTEAEQLFVQVTETMKTVLGPEHPDTLMSMANLASTFRDQGRWTEAEQLEVQVMKTRKTVLGPEHPDTLTSMNNLASTFSKQGRWTEAEQLFVQVMETRKTVLGPEHPDTLTSMNNLAFTFSKQGRWTEAEQLFVQVMETRKTVLGPEHPDTLTSMNNLAFTFSKQGRWAETEQLFVQVTETMKTVLGPEHPNTLTSMDNLSHTLRSLGKPSEALSMLETCVRLRQKRLGASHPHTVSAVETLDDWQAEGIHTDLSEESSSDASPGPVDPTTSDACTL